MKTKPNKKNKQRYCYISGSISNATDEEKELFSIAEEEYRQKGFCCYNPLAMDSVLGLTSAKCVEGGSQRAIALKRDCCWICDHLPLIVMLSTFSKSSGSLMERALGTALGLEIVYYKPNNKALQAARAAVHADDNQRRNEARA
jgi:hypothetical protein